MATGGAVTGYDRWTRLVVEVGYGIAAVAFLALFVLTGLSKIRSRQRRILLIVTGVNFVWALSIACSPLIALPAWLLVMVEVARIASWLVFTIDLMGLLRQSAAELRLLKFLGVGLPAAVAGYILIQPMLQAYAGIDWLPAGSALWMLIPVAGILLLENLFRNADRDTRWALKHLCIAIGVIYIYDFFYFADAMALGRPSATLFGARGFVNAMMVPLLALGVARSRSWPVAIHVSRGVMFHSFALVGSGLYLVTMAAASYYLRRIEWRMGTLATDHLSDWRRVNLGRHFRLRVHARACQAFHQQEFLLLEVRLPGDLDAFRWGFVINQSRSWASTVVSSMRWQT